MLDSDLVIDRHAQGTIQAYWIKGDKNETVQKIFPVCMADTTCRNKDEQQRRYAKQLLHGNISECAKKVSQLYARPGMRLL